MSRSRLLETALPMVAKTLEGAILVKPDDDETDRVLTFKFGTLSLPEQKETPKTRMKKRTSSRKETYSTQTWNVYNCNSTPSKARPNLDKVTTAASL